MTPKDIVTKERESLSGQQIYRHANFQTDRWHLRRDICLRTETDRQLHKMTCPTKRVLALRLQDKT